MVAGKLVSIGIILLFLGVILIFVGSLFSTFKSEKSNVKSAGIIFIGPVPFGWASDKKMFYTLIAITLIFIAIWLVFFRRF